MTQPRIPRCCRCFRHFGLFVFMALLLTMLNLVGYHYLCGAQTCKLHVLHYGRDGHNAGPDLPVSNLSRTRELQAHAPASVEGKTPAAKRLANTSDAAAVTSESRDTSKVKHTVTTEAVPFRTTLRRGLYSPLSFTSSSTSSRSSPLTKKLFSYSSAFGRAAAVFTSKRIRKSRIVTSLFRNVTSGQSTGLAPDCGKIAFKSKDKDLKWFKPALNGWDLCGLMDAMDAFSAALTKAGIPFIMYGGTLLGSWRHHGFVPWDDDMDFWVPMELRQNVYRLLMDLKPRFVLDVKQKKRWKLYSAEKSHPIPGVSWKYPFLDINFYHENSSHVWDHDTGSYKMYVYPRDWIFPLRPRPFNGRMLMAPRQSERCLRLTYNLELCQTGLYNHRRERRNQAKERKSVECEKLHEILPFVTRVSVGGGCNETLVQNGRILSNYFFDNIKC